MEYKKIDLFGTQKSRGTFDDFYDTEKYDTLGQAYDANDYVECDFVQDTEGVLYIEAKNISKPNIKKHYRLQIQRPYAGIDVVDDNLACEMAVSLF